MLPNGLAYACIVQLFAFWYSGQQAFLCDGGVLSLRPLMIVQVFLFLGRLSLYWQCFISLVDAVVIVILGLVGCNLQYLFYMEPI